MRVTFDLLDPDDADLVCDVAEEHGFRQYDDTGEQFETANRRFGPQSQFLLGGSISSK